MSASTVYKSVQIDSKRVHEEQRCFYENLLFRCTNELPWVCRHTPLPEVNLSIFK